MQIQLLIFQHIKYMYKFMCLLTSVSVPLCLHYSMLVKPFVTTLKTASI